MTAIPDPAPIEITKPGVYDLDAETYHADPVPGESLSSTGARRILATCPAKFRYEVDHRTTPTRAMELGTAAHKVVLGAGTDLTVVKYRNYRTTAAQETRDAIRAAGGVPLLPDEWDTVQEMADALRQNELASVLLGGTGKPEQALFWKDGPTGLWRRALLDWLPPAGPDGRLYLADYKKAKSAHPDEISRAIETYGYHMQGAWYVDAVRALELAEDVAYFLVVQEPDPPYLVSVVQLDQVALDAGRHRNRKALRLYAECRKSGHWPAYVEGVQQVGLPGWAENQFLKEVTS